MIEGRNRKGGRIPDFHMQTGREISRFRLHWVKSYRSHGLDLTLPDFPASMSSVQVSPQSGRASRVSKKVPF